MRATRDALENPWQTVWVVDEAERGAQPSIVERDTTAALAEVEAVEAVAEAARALWPWHRSAEMRWMSMEDAEVSVRARYVSELCRALARLDALTDGQGSNAAVTDSESSAWPRCMHCGAKVWWSAPRPEDPCYECRKPIAGDCGEDCA